MWRRDPEEGLLLALHLHRLLLQQKRKSLLPGEHALARGSVNVSTKEQWSQGFYSQKIWFHKVMV